MTLLTDQAPDGGIVSTWQLGGTLSDDTEINAGGKKFAITLDGSDGTFVLNGIQEETGDAAATLPATGAGTGFTLLTRDEVTGQVKKLLVTDLITSGQTYFTAVKDQFDYDVTGTGGNNIMTGNQVPLPDFSKVWVYRNGAKLIANVDYEIVANVVKLKPNTTAPNDWTIYAGDIIEVQYYK